MKRLTKRNTLLMRQHIEAKQISARRDV